MDHGDDHTIASMAQISRSPAHTSTSTIHVSCCTHRFGGLICFRKLTFTEIVHRYVAYSQGVTSACTTIHVSMIPAEQLNQAHLNTLARLLLILKSDRTIDMPQNANLASS